VSSLTYVIPRYPKSRQACQRVCQGSRKPTLIQSDRIAGVHLAINRQLLFQYSEPRVIDMLPIPRTVSCILVDGARFANCDTQGQLSLGQIGLPQKGPCKLVQLRTEIGKVNLRCAPANTRFCSGTAARGSEIAQASPLVRLSVAISWKWVKVTDLVETRRTWDSIPTLT